MRAKTDNERRVGRRNMIAGLLAGIIVATVAGAYAKTTFKAMKKGDPATAADVNAAHQNLADAIDALETKVTAQAAEIAKLKTDPKCPPGYIKDTTAPATITVCKRGSDEMVKVGDFWIDRFEIQIADATRWNSGKCDGTGGTCYGCVGTFQDNYPASFPDSGNWTAPLYACSVDTSGSSSKHYPPSRGMTWFQAQQACALSGKHLCTNGEWQTAASGTTDSTLCNTNSKGSWSIGYTGQFPKCISSYGARDMIGNAAEWVDLWGQAGKDWGTSSSKTTPWPISGGYGDAQDQTANIEGQVLAKYNGAPVNGMPAAATRGGHYGLGTKAGVFNIALNSGPTFSIPNLGARCCIGGK